MLPETVQVLTHRQIGELPVYEGNRKRPLADFFEVRGEPGDGRLIWEGDLTGVHWIGTKMRTGEIEIQGNVGRHVGSEMIGGRIDVHGDVGDWVGAEMRGGTIHVRGRGHHLVGAAYRGSSRGMTGGTIMIEGQAGNEVGHTMRRGLIAIGGDCGDLVGFNMLAGTILVFGNAGIRHGAGMRRGTIGMLGGEAVPVLPTFRSAGRIDSLAMNLVMRNLDSLGFPLPEDAVGMSYHAYHGDLLEGGRGELLVRLRI